jgi:hypothetical protein
VEYKVGDVTFDGVHFVEESGTPLLLEAKGEGYAKLFKDMIDKKFFEGVEELLEQAGRQEKAAKAVGARLVWAVAEEEAAVIMRSILEGADMSGVPVWHVPMPK